VTVSPAVKPRKAVVKPAAKPAKAGK